MESHNFFLQTNTREEMIDITEEIKEILQKKSSIRNGYIKISIPHTTAGVTINENADRAVENDILHILRKIIPKSRDYSHAEGNSDAHMKSSLMGTRVDIMLEHGQLKLGRWQGIFFCEFDGPRSRKVYVNIFKE
ncbi:MAG: YjbQ family protein [Candidatus Lokiarchaeota archaeon]|nr:YjbQ family protein [Candidatus Lokiarchaeota archaeon]